MNSAVQGFVLAVVRGPAWLRLEGVCLAMVTSQKSSFLLDVAAMRVLSWSKYAKSIIIGVSSLVCFMTFSLVLSRFTRLGVLKMGLKQLFDGFWLDFHSFGIFEILGNLGGLRDISNR